MINNNPNHTDPANIWAPWRMEYLQNITELEKGCFLCDYRDNPQRDADNLVIARGESVFAVLNRFPYTGGHCLIAPYAHLGELADLPVETLTEIMELVRDTQLAMKHAFNPDAFNVGINLGRAAGAGLPDHLHTHIVPRWSGDTNFMPVLGKVSVVPEFLTKTRDRLIESAAELGLARFLKPGE